MKAHLHDSANLIGSLYCFLLEPLRSLEGSLSITPQSPSVWPLNATVGVNKTLRYCRPITWLWRTSAVTVRPKNESIFVTSSSANGRTYSNDGNYWNIHFCRVSCIEFFSQTWFKLQRYQHDSWLIQLRAEGLLNIHDYSPVVKFHLFPDVSCYVHQTSIDSVKIANLNA